MAAYDFVCELAFGDTDPSAVVRHLIPESSQRLLHANHVHKLQSRFREIGFDYMVGNINGCFNNKLRAAVLSFQSQASSERRLVKDRYSGRCAFKSVPVTWRGESHGRIDEATALELKAWLENDYLNSAPKALIRLEHTWVRPEVANALRRVSENLQSRGCHFPLEGIGGFRNPANVDRTVGMKAHSLHCAGLAIDFDEWRGMQNPETDYYYIARGRELSYWVLYMRSNDSTLAEEQINAIYFDSRNKTYTVHAVRGRFLNVTAVLMDEGLHPISPHSGWENEYYKSEWWHFQLADVQGSWVHHMEAIGYTRGYLSEIGYC